MWRKRKQFVAVRPSFKGNHIEVIRKVDLPKNNPPPQAKEIKVERMVIYMCKGSNLGSKCCSLKGEERKLRSERKSKQKEGAGSWLSLIQDGEIGNLVSWSWRGLIGQGSWSWYSSIGISIRRIICSGSTLKEWEVLALVDSLYFASLVSLWCVHW